MKSSVFRIISFGATVLMVQANYSALAAAEASGPSKLIEAAEQVTHAESLIAACQYDEAEYWLGQALRNARAARSKATLDQDTAGVFVARLEIRQRELRAERKSWDRAAKETPAMVSSGRLESARTRIREIGAPTCDARFKEITETIDNRQRQANRLLQNGDAQISTSPAAARDLYLQAWVVDHEIPGIDDHIQNAQARISYRFVSASRSAGQQPAHDGESSASGRCVRCGFAKAAKIIAFTALAGGLGYGAYRGYELYEQHQQQRAAQTGR